MTTLTEKIIGSFTLSSEQLATIAANITPVDISGKVDKITGKGLSTEDYTTAEQTKLSGIASGATSGADWNTNVSNKPTIPTALSALTDDSTHRIVSDTEKSTWNGKGSSNLTLGNLSSNAYPGDTGKTAYDHSQAAHAPSNAQKNSDIIQSEIEAKLTGTVSSHSHAQLAFLSPYRIILDSSGSHIAAKVAGTYGMGQGDPLAVTGTGTLYPLNTIYIAAADYPTIDGKVTKLRIRAIVECNDVAPFTGTFKIGLHPVTRPGTSGGAGVCIYTIGSPATGSQVTGTNLAADSQNQLVGSDFDLPTDGFYVIAVVTSGTMATSSHVHISASLQIHNV